MKIEHFNPNDESLGFLSLSEHINLVNNTNSLDGYYIVLGLTTIPITSILYDYYDNDNTVYVHREKIKRKKLFAEEVKPNKIKKHRQYNHFIDEE